MAISDSEVESLRFHLNFGNIGLGASAYSADGFKELFDDVIAAYLTGGAETTVASAISIGTAAVTPAAMTDIVAQARLVIDVGDDAEIVAVKSVTATAFTAAFTKAHSAGCAVAVMSGHARLRLLLHRADATWQAMQASDIGDTAGIKRIEGDIEYFPGGDTLKGRQAAYKVVVTELFKLVRLEPSSGRTSLLEAY